MRQLPALDMSSNVTKFWRSYVYIGVLTYSLGASAVLPTRWPRRDRTGGDGDPERAELDCLHRGFRLLGLRLVETRGPSCSSPRGPPAPSCSSPSERSSTAASVVRFRTSSFCRCSSPDWRTRRERYSFLAGFGVLTTLVVGFLTPDRSWSTTVFLAVGIVIAGVITAAAAAQRDRLMRQLMAAASLDALTGCLARGAFQERLDHQSLLAERHYATFSVIVADVDNLKTLNDANGHHCGDRALKLLAGVLGRLPARPRLGRLGGDVRPVAPRDRSGRGHGHRGTATRRTARRDGFRLGHRQHRGQHVARSERRAGRAVAACRRGPLRGQAFRPHRAAAWEQPATEPQLGLQLLAGAARRRSLPSVSLPSRRSADHSTGRSSAPHGCKWTLPSSAMTQPGLWATSQG